MENKYKELLKRWDVMQSIAIPKVAAKPKEKVKPKKAVKSKKTYTLDDCIKRAAQHPDTFYIPSFKSIQQVRIGDNVKLIFQGSKLTERMWVVVTAINATATEISFEGTVDNDPLNPDIKYMDKVKFENKHIANLYE